MLEIGLYSARDQAGYVQDELIGELDTPDWALQYGSVSQGSYEELELYLQNTSSSESLESGSLVVINPSETKISGELSLSTTPTHQGGDAEHYYPANHQTLIKDTLLEPTEKEFFFVKINVGTNLGSGAQSGPKLKFQGRAKGI